MKESSKHDKMGSIACTALDDTYSKDNASKANLVITNCKGTPR